eukprot:318385-Prorocentrum_lima.AAC.1
MFDKFDWRSFAQAVPLRVSTSRQTPEHAELREAMERADASKIVDVLLAADASDLSLLREGCT